MASHLAISTVLAWNTSVNAVDDDFNTSMRGVNQVRQPTMSPPTMMFTPPQYTFAIWDSRSMGGALMMTIIKLQSFANRRRA